MHESVYKTVRLKILTYSPTKLTGIVSYHFKAVTNVAIDHVAIEATQYTIQLP